MNSKKQLLWISFLFLTGCTSAKDEFDMKIRCSEYVAAQKKLADAQGESFYEVFYSPQLNTCVTAKWSGDSPPIYGLYDIFTGETLYSETAKPEVKDSVIKKWKDRIAEIKKSKS